jgi:hypothetical protein
LQRSNLQLIVFMHYDQCNRHVFRNGALDKESYTEDTYPNLMKKCVGFRNEMSVILVLWHDCQQLIDRYNEEQVIILFSYLTSDISF